jgi:hypothetical protein
LQTANVGSTNPNSHIVADGYLALINVLSCVDKDQRWILSNVRADEGRSERTKRTKLENDSLSVVTHHRKVLTLEDIKSGYQAEVERVSLLLNGGFFV